MTQDTARWLLTDEAGALIAAAGGLRQERAEVTLALNRLRKRAAPERAAAAWEMAGLRTRARAKFGPDASRMFFLREALEQASGARAAAYHARRFAEAGVGTVADVCGGIGGDALAFARAGLRVTLYERDPDRALFAEANAAALGLDTRVTVTTADITSVDVPEEAVWFDPARRSGDRGSRGRVGSPEDYQPPLSTLRRWTGKGLGVKLAPAIEHSLADDYDADLEFVSDGGECKEALLWAGALRAGTGTRAVLLTDRGTHRLEADPTVNAPVAGPSGGRVLYEPDPAARELGAALLAPQIAYLIGEAHVATPFATAYDVLERFSYSRRRLQEALARRQVGRVVIKKRGFPQEPDDVRRGLTLRGPEAVTVVLTRAALEPGHQALLCRPCLEG
jgi:hypothetical protein